jgi:serralysin
MDVIDLSGIDANSKLAGDQAFTLVAAFTRSAGQLTMSVEGDGYAVRGDTNGDGAADFGFTVMAGDPLAASAFLL